MKIHYTIHTEGGIFTGTLEGMMEPTETYDQAKESAAHTVYNYIVPRLAVKVLSVCVSIDKPYVYAPNTTLETVGVEEIIKP